MRIAASCESAYEYARIWLNCLEQLLEIGGLVTCPRRMSHPYLLSLALTLTLTSRHFCHNSFIQISPPL
jgi:hypothetical protein